MANYCSIPTAAEIELHRSEMYAQETRALCGILRKHIVKSMLAGNELTRFAIGRYKSDVMNAACAQLHKEMSDAGWCDLQILHDCPEKGFIQMSWAHGVR